MTDPGALTRAREAYRAREWKAARDGFDAVRAAVGLEAEELRALASSAWWLGRPDECLSVLEETFRLQRADRADIADSADTALTIALLRITCGEVTVGSAWARRARRMLDEAAPCRQHALLAYLEATLGLYESGEPWSSSAVAEIAALAEALDDPTATALAAVVAGMHDLRSGDPASGFAHLDEAMLCLLADDLPAVWAGDVLCTTIHACHELADYGRMADWTNATERWSADHGADEVYSGVCRVHRLELRSAVGDWRGAEAALQRTCDLIRASDPWVAGEGWYQLGELRRLRGDVDGARHAFALTRESGIDPAPGEALLELSTGDGERAWALLTAALAGRDRLARVRLLRAGVQIALARGDGASAEMMHTELAQAAERFGTDGFRAWEDHARGMLQLARRECDAALESFHAALRLFRHLGLRWEQAHSLEWIAAAHEAAGDRAASESVRADAHAIVAGLGASRIPVVFRVARPAAEAGPLTPREREVLEQVAGGASNRAIAEHLYISEKTVSRHLANIYRKLGVGSRTAAAAWWHEHVPAPGIR